MTNFTTEIMETLINKGDLDDLFRIQLFQKGITMSEISELIEKMYGHYYTPQTISNITQIVSEDVVAFKERSLESQYSIIFMDATHIPLKRQTVSKEAVYIVIGIRLDGTKEVLGFSIAPTESSYVWKEILQDLKDRGLDEVLLVVTDGLSGINDSIHSIYPNAQFQQCCVHISRNIAHKVRVSDRQEVCNDFKLVYQAASKEEAMNQISSTSHKIPSPISMMVMISNNNTSFFFILRLIC
ncbi:transposase [Enterococcus saccharolyticus subsp. saccharolyticus ATCC 43076]|uniref:Mutator family transposase n=1 Tax=Enterococcus saccharolyticus subsp. saccharolyticus ATCC 43076 TaxID=1139996 RepID=S0JPZ0_9ENTE|nr:IS256 family transposase [Enterococcus saccharolyticus]EOT29978.1 transposase [Enterococcus saccharolyticus subsp. saccharolyticus ATCC 43076]EOT80524.1 transposase [Enterococcus saccharolyticus subsp. saccharolyticus ATCC 43076]